MRFFPVLTLILTVAAAGVSCSKEASPDQWNRAALLPRLDKLLALLHHRFEQESTPDDRARLTRVSEVLQSARFRLINGKIVEKSPRELLDRLVTQVRTESRQKISGDFEDALEMLRAEAQEAMEMISLESDDDCPNATDAPDVALDELTLRCTKGGEFHDVLGCVGAATLYCHRMFPRKSSSELLGLVTNRKSNVLSIACLDQSSVIFSPQVPLFQEHVRDGCEQYGASNLCRLFQGTEYAGFYTERVSLKSLGEDQENLYMVGCFKAAKRLLVDYSKLQTENNECRAANPVRNYACMREASSYCRQHFGYTGGVVQRSPNPQTAEIVCFNAFYTGEAHISRDNDYRDAKNSLKKICSLDFEVNKGKILDATPELLKSGKFDNRNSDVESRDIFTVSTSVTTENEFTHSHSFRIGMEITKKAKIPFIAEASIKVSASYSATVRLTAKNSKTTQFTYTSEVFVPPFKGILKKAVITRTRMDVPWRAVGINGIGRRVEIYGTWQGVDVSDIEVYQENLK